MLMCMLMNQNSPFKKSCASVETSLKTEKKDNMLTMLNVHGFPIFIGKLSGFFSSYLLNVHISYLLK